MIHKFTAKFILISLIVIFLVPSALAQPQDDGSAEEMINATKEMDDEELSRYLGSPLDFTGEDKFGDPLTEQEKNWQILSEAKNHLQTVQDILNNKNRLDINEHDRRLLRQYLEAGLLNERGENSSYLKAELKPYDVRVLGLLEKLIMPEDKGGAGFEYLKIDRIRRNYELERKQVSRETEGAENISAHTMGQAVDITAIDKTQCTIKGYFRKKKMKPFPNKVEWQTTQRPDGARGLAVSDNFNEITEEMAFSEIRDLLSGNKEIRANAWKWLFFEVGKNKLSEELDLEDGALDDTTKETFFKDVGLAMIGKKLELPDFRALDGANLEEISIKVALSYFEYDLELPRGSLSYSFKSGTNWEADWKDILSSIGKRKVEKDLNLTLGTLDKAKLDVDSLGRQKIERVWDLKSGTFTGNSLEEMKGRDLQGIAMIQKMDVEQGTQGIDDQLNISKGSTHELIIGRLSVQQYIQKAGEQALLTENQGILSSAEQAMINKYNPDLYKDADLAFNMPDVEDGARASSVERLRRGDETVYVAIGASVLADSLNYNDEEKRKLISNAESGIFAELNLNKKSFSLKLTREEIDQVFRGDNGARKQALIGGGTRLLDNVLQDKIIRMDEEAREAIIEEIQTQDKNQTRLYFSDVRGIIGNKERMERITYNGSAKKMENQFGLPEYSLKYTLIRDVGGKNPEDIVRSLEDNFTKNVGEAYIERSMGLKENSLQSDDLLVWRASGTLPRFSNSPGAVDQRLNLAPGKTAEMVRGQINLADYKKQVGELALGGALADSFADGLDLPQIGDYDIKPSDLIGFFTGRWEDALLKVGANFAEEEFDLPSGTIYRIASQEGKETPENIFLAAGGQRLASTFNMQYLDLQGVNSADDFQSSLGRQKTEQILGLETGTFTGDISQVENKNFQRMQAIRKMDQDGKKGIKGFDILLDLPDGSTHKLLQAEITVLDFTKLVGERALAIASGIQLWDRFGWDEKYSVSGSELFNAVKADRFDLLKGVFEKIAGFNLDNVFGFQPGTSTLLARAANNELERNALLIEQGAIKLTKALGMNPVFANHFIMTYRHYRHSDPSADSTKVALHVAISEATKIPYDLNHQEDVKAFTNGNIEKGLEFFTAAQFVEQWKEKGVSFNYDDVRAAVAFNDKDKQDLIAVSVAEYYLTKDNEWARYMPTGFLRSWMESAKLAEEAKNEKDPQKKKEKEDAITQTQTNLILGWIGNLARANKLGDIFQGINGGDLVELNHYFNLPEDKRKDPQILERLANNGVFTAIDRNSEKWFGFQFQSGTGNALFQYSMTNDISAFQKDLTEIHEDWATSKIGSWMDKQLGFKNGTSNGLYQDYDYIKGLNNSFKAGGISEDQLYAMIATRLFGKELNKLEHKWNLPPGAIQDVVLGTVAALSGNIPQAVYHIGMLFYKMMFEVWRVKCPDLQKTAQEKVRKLLGDILAIGKNNPALLPSQIMTFSEDDVLYFSAQLDQLYPERRVPTVNYGMGFNPDMYDRVHIGY